MSQSLTKLKWGELKEVLLHVPIRARTAVWRASMDFVEAVLNGRNNLAPTVDLKTMRFSVECELCGDLIKIDEDYVYHGIRAKYVHYDCHHRSSKPIDEKESA